MTFHVVLQGHATNSTDLPYEKEMSLVKQAAAEFRAKLEAAGCTVAICTVNGETVIAEEAEVEADAVAEP